MTLKIQVGQPKVGKTPQAKRLIGSDKEKTLIFDFNDSYTEVDGTIVELDGYHPLIDSLNQEEVKVLNAGYLRTSRCLYDQASEIFKENKERKYRDRIINETLERLNASWESYKVEYARDLSDRIPLKIGAKQESLQEVVEIIKENSMVIVKANNIHSDHLRAMVYMILYKISIENLDIQVIADEISTLLFKGNFKMLLDTIDKSKLDILVSCNRPSNIPKNLKGEVDEWLVFKNTDKSENKVLRNNFKIAEDIDIEAIKKGQYETIKAV